MSVVLPVALITQPAVLAYPRLPSRVLLVDEVQSDVLDGVAEGASSSVADRHVGRHLYGRNLEDEVHGVGAVVAAGVDAFAALLEAGDGAGEGEGGSAESEGEGF